MTYVLVVTVVGYVWRFLQCSCITSSTSKLVNSTQSPESSGTLSATKLEVVLKVVKTNPIFMPIQTNPIFNIAIRFKKMA